MNFGLAHLFVKGHTTSVTILLNDLNSVECVMAMPSAENVDPSGPSAMKVDLGQNVQLVISLWRLVVLRFCYGVSSCRFLMLTQRIASLIRRLVSFVVLAFRHVISSFRHVVSSFRLVHSESL